MKDAIIAGIAVATNFGQCLAVLLCDRQIND